jgi:hypothetical protein
MAINISEEHWKPPSRLHGIMTRKTTINIKILNPPPPPHHIFHLVVHHCDRYELYGIQMPGGYDVMENNVLTQPTVCVQDLKRINMTLNLNMTMDLARKICSRY